MPKRRKDKHILGKLEMEIMQSLWRDGDSSCRDVFEKVGLEHSYAYTTILTMMKHLEKKGFVTHFEDGRTFIYQPLIPQDDIEQRMLSDFLASVFSGSPLGLVNTLIRSGNISDEELHKIEKAIRDAQDTHRDE